MKTLILVILLLLFISVIVDTLAIRTEPEKVSSNLQDQATANAVLIMKNFMEAENANVNAFSIQPEKVVWPIFRIQINGRHKICFPKKGCIDFSDVGIHP